jgi:hypothetical protein
MLVVFGAPVAHEDDAIRAVRAGLEMVTAVTEARSTKGSPSIGISSLDPGRLTDGVVENQPGPDGERDEEQDLEVPHAREDDIQSGQ